jgi:hypothetical protein
MNIGSDPLTNLVYEGAFTANGHAVWPNPVLSPALVVARISEDISSQMLDSPQSIQPSLVFREDSFDPVSRVRRGRFYLHDGNKQWTVLRHPVGDLDTLRGNGTVFRKDLWTYRAADFFDHFKDRKIVAMGSKKALSLWSIVGIERIFTGEDLVTLRSRTTFGILPELKSDLVLPEKELLEEKLNSVADDAHRSGPESIVDHCREATAAALYSRLKQVDPSQKPADLGDLIRAFESNEGLKGQMLTIFCAKIISRLHPRRKTSEALARGLPAVKSADGDLAVLCLGTVLWELGWADWV